MERGFNQDAGIEGCGAQLLPQIHQKPIHRWNTSHRITTKCWQKSSLNQRNQSRTWAPGRELWKRKSSFTLGTSLAGWEINQDRKGASEAQRREHQRYIHSSAHSCPMNKTWKQPKCLSTDEQIKKMWCIHTMEYYWAIKKEWNSAICINMDGPRDYHTNWSKLDRERQIPYHNHL